ncbi:transposable element Tcb1 transposase [Trichonephila clavipes]|nr:transposable element Tcb1 transposase [Trichonephila clavipes]
MSRRKQRSAFDQVSEFDRGRIGAYLDCGLSFREIGSRVGRNQCDRWMQEGTMDRRSRSHPPQCTTSLTQLSQHHDGRIRVWRHRGERMLNSCVKHRHTGPAPGIMDNARPHVARIVQRFFVNHQIELLPLPARCLDLLPIENMWSMVAQRVTHITPLAATPDQLWQRVEAAWSAVLPGHIQSLFESMPRRVAVVISNNGGYSGYRFWQEPHFTEVNKFNHLILGQQLRLIETCFTKCLFSVNWEQENERTKDKSNIRSNGDCIRNDSPSYDNSLRWERIVQIGHMSLTDDSRSGRSSFMDDVTGTTIDNYRVRLKLNHRNDHEGN